MAEAQSEQAGSFVTRGRSFVAESIEELHKVSKPTRQETMQFTLVTIVIIVFIAVCLMVLDLVFNQLMSALLT